MICQTLLLNNKILLISAISYFLAKESDIYTYHGRSCYAVFGASVVEPLWGSRPPVMVP